MTPRQCRAARALLEMTQGQLANKANIAKSTVADYERGARSLMPNNKFAIINVFHKYNVVFFKGGVVFNNEDWAL